MKSVTPKVSAFVLFASALFISACGGGGGDGSGDGINNGGEALDISIGGFPASINAVEGDVVTVSLNVTGPDAEFLTYDWELDFGDAEIAFTGDDTDTISFVAPEVEPFSIVQVSVEVSLDGFNIIGLDDFNTVVSVFDLDIAPSIPAHEVGMRTGLPEVDAIDFSSVVSSSTWLLRRYEQQTLDIEGIETVRSTVSREIINIENIVSANVIDLAFCGVSGPVSTDLAALGEGFDCDEASQELNFYQDDEAFRAELSCAGQVVNAFDFIFVSDTSQADFGQLEITFDTFADLEPTSACGETVLSNLDQGNTASDESSVRLVSEYQNQPIELVVGLEDSTFIGSFSLDSSPLNFVTLTSDALPTISGITNNDSGLLVIVKGSPIEVDGSLDIQTTDVNLAEENIEIEFSLDFSL